MTAWIVLVAALVVAAPVILAALGARRRLAQRRRPAAVQQARPETWRVVPPHYYNVDESSGDPDAPAERIYTRIDRVQTGRATDRYDLATPLGRMEILDDEIADLRGQWIRVIVHRVDEPWRDPSGQTNLDQRKAWRREARAVWVELRDVLERIGDPARLPARICGGGRTDYDTAIPMFENLMSILISADYLWERQPMAEPGDSGADRARRNQLSGAIRRYIQAISDLPAYIRLRRNELPMLEGIASRLDR